MRIERVKGERLEKSIGSCLHTFIQKDKTFTNIQYKNCISFSMGLLEKFGKVPLNT